MATHTHITSTKASLPRLPPNPSILDLARYETDLWARHEAADIAALKLKDLSPACCHPESVMRRLTDQITLTGKLILTQHPRTLPDIAGLASVAFTFANYVADSKEAEEAGIAHDLDALEVVFARIAILAADLAGVDLAEFRPKSTIDLLRNSAAIEGDGIDLAAEAAQDARLLTLVDDLEALDRMSMADETPGANFDSQKMEAHLAVWWERADEIKATPAHTPEGIRAKHRALRCVHRMLGAGEGMDTLHDHVEGLLADLLGPAPEAEYEGELAPA